MDNQYGCRLEYETIDVCGWLQRHYVDGDLSIDMSGKLPSCDGKLRVYALHSLSVQPTSPENKARVIKNLQRAAEYERLGY